MTEPTTLAQLRHLYQNMVNGAVRDTASAKRIAEGLLAPAIEALERATPPAVAEPFGWLYEWTHSSATGRADETYTGFTKDEQHARKHDNCRAVYTTPQPTQAQPLTDGQAKEVLWTEHLRWMQAAGLDTEGMRPTGEWLDHWLIYVRAIERAHGITKEQA